MRSPLRIRLGICALLIAGTGCYSKPEPLLRVGAIVWPGYECLFLARSLGYYDDAPLQLVEYPSTPEVIRAFQNGAIEIAALTGDETLRLAQQNPEIRILLVMDFSKGADAILGKKETKQMSDLKGRRVAVEPNSVGTFLLSRALELAGLTTRDITVVPVENNAHVAAFSSPNIAGIVTFEPHRSKLIAQEANVLFDSSRIPGEIMDFLVVRKDMLSERAAALTQLLNGWFRARAYMQRHPRDAAKRLSPREGCSPEQFLESLKVIEIPTAEENLAFLGANRQATLDKLHQLTQFMLKQKLLNSAPQPAALLESSVLELLRGNANSDSSKSDAN